MTETVKQKAYWRSMSPQAATGAVTSLADHCQIAPGRWLPAVDLAAAVDRIGEALERVATERGMVWFWAQFPADGRRETVRLQFWPPADLAVPAFDSVPHNGAYPGMSPAQVLLSLVRRDTLATDEPDRTWLFVASRDGWLGVIDERNPLTAPYSRNEHPGLELPATYMPED